MPEETKQSIVRLVKELGFPIVMCGVLFWQSHTQNQWIQNKLTALIESNVDSKNELTKAVNSLREAIDSK